MWKRIKLGLAVCLGLTLLLAVTGYAYVHSLDLDIQTAADPRSRTADLAFVRDGERTPRGKVLAVVTITERIGSSDKRAGFELTELARAYFMSSSPTAMRWTSPARLAERRRCSSMRGWSRPITPFSTIQ